MAKPTSRDELIAMYQGENEPSHGLNSLQNSDDAAQQDKLTRAIAGELGLTSEDRLSQYLEEEFSGKSGLAQYPAIGVPATVAAGVGGGLGVTPYGSDGKVSGTPRTGVARYTPLPDEFFGGSPYDWEDPRIVREFGETPLRQQISADEIVAIREGRGEIPYESYEYKKIGKNWVSPDGIKVSDDVMRAWMQDDMKLIKKNWPEIYDQELNRALEASQRRLAGFGSEAQTEAARAASRWRSVAASQAGGIERALELADADRPTAIRPTPDRFERAMQPNRERLYHGADSRYMPSSGRYYVTDGAWQQRRDREVLGSMRRHFNQSAIASELSKVPGVSKMAGAVSRAIPPVEALFLIAEPLLLFAHKFDDPSEGTFGISFGTQLKSMAATLTQSTGKPTPLKTKHLAPEAIQRLRDEPETAQDLYNFGAISEELWKEVKPRSGEPLVQWGEPSELPPSVVAWQEEYARQQEDK